MVVSGCWWLVDVAWGTLTEMVGLAEAVKKFPRGALKSVSASSNPLVCVRQPGLLASLSVLLLDRYRVRNTIWREQKKRWYKSPHMSSAEKSLDWWRGHKRSNEQAKIDARPGPAEGRPLT